MPTDTVRVVRVVKTETRQPGLYRYRIDADTLDGLRRLQYGTVNAWLASLCDRAARGHYPVTVTWRQTRYGQTVTAVDRLTGDEALTP